ncbi:peptide N-acetyl-beta-D-glucosaminyl asparaginase amidase A-domain-containing protein [Melampsora americana]|nr:peptide N-acetyl-beta-D-glucosaminyl asparaginase amidase A-domain-containing protein [Melampsora americana]
MELSNIIDLSIGIDGSFAVTLSATYYRPTDDFLAPPSADLILPISKAGGNRFTENPAVSAMTIPKSTVSAFVEIYASGSAKEEFWYTNVLDEAVPDITSNSTNASVLNAKGPYRELQLWIDDTLAGVANPYPVLFTGGIILTWWRPIAAYGAFDQPTYMIDITPFIPTLTDGKSHNFTLSVEGQGVNRTINDNFQLSGNIAIIKDPSGVRTTGKMENYVNKPKVSTGGEICKEGIRTVVRAQRKLSISSTLITGSGKKEVTFSQYLSYKNTQLWGPNGRSQQQVNQGSAGLSKSTVNSKISFSEEFSYPLALSLETKKEGLFGILRQGYSRSIKPPKFGGFSTQIKSNQTSKGNLQFGSAGRVSGGFGQTEQNFTYSDSKGSTYERQVGIANVTILLRDKQSGTLAPRERHITQSARDAIEGDGRSFMAINPTGSLELEESVPVDQFSGQAIRVPSFIQLSSFSSVNSK